MIQDKGSLFGSLFFWRMGILPRKSFIITRKSGNLLLQPIQPPMTTVRILLIMCIFSIYWTSSSAQERSTRETKPFHSIEVSSGIDLYLKQGDSASIEVLCEKEFIKRIETNINDSILTIKASQPMRWGFDKSPKVYVTFVTLKSLIATSGADVYGTGVYALQSMSLAAHSGADIYLTMEGDITKVNASGGSDIKLSGKTNLLKANISSGSDLNAADFKTNNCDITVSGGSDAIVNVSVSLFCDASGGSDIGYLGEPKLKELTESGGSDIYRK